MSIVNFSVSEPLEQQINQIIASWGFNSKAEFFRFLAIDFINRNKKRNFIVDKETERLSEELSALIKEKINVKKLPSLEDQLADLI